MKIKPTNYAMHPLTQHIFSIGRDIQTQRIRNSFTHWWHQYTHWLPNVTSTTCHPQTSISNCWQVWALLIYAACKLVFPGSHATSLTQYPMAQLSTRSIA